MKLKGNDTELLAEAYEDLFKNQFIKEEDEQKEEKEEKDEPKEEKEEKSEGDSEEKSEEKEEPKSDSPFGPSKSEEKSEESDDESEEGEESEEGSEEGGDAGVKSKVEKLQKQYNDILIDAFEKYAPECIEGALGNVKSSFGENIEGILDDALKQLKDKIMGDLGIESAMGGLGGMEVDMGDDHGVDFGANVGGVPTISVTGDQSELEDQENPEHEAEESPEEETEERESGNEDEVEEESVVAEKKGNKEAFMKMIAAKKGKGKKDKKEESLSESVANFYGYK